MLLSDVSQSPLSALASLGPASTSSVSISSLSLTQIILAGLAGLCCFFGRWRLWTWLTNHVHAGEIFNYFIFLVLLLNSLSVHVNGQQGDGDWLCDVHRHRFFPLVYAQFEGDQLPLVRHGSRRRLSRFPHECWIVCIQHHLRATIEYAEDAVCLL